VIEQKDLSLAGVLGILEHYTKDPGMLKAMSSSARAVAILDASSRIASTCQEVMHD
jgi:UDP-N-acetylglucosamine:LPS N-acetylglucosamine transferase